MDQTADDLRDAVERLSVIAGEMKQAGHHHSLDVGVETHWRWIFVDEGIYVYDWWTEFFAPVRRRRLLSRSWSMLQPVEYAARDARALLGKLAGGVTTYRTAEG